MPKRLQFQKAVFFHLQATWAFEIIAPKTSYFYILLVANSSEEGFIKHMPLCQGIRLYLDKKETQSFPFVEHKRIKF